MTPREQTSRIDLSKYAERYLNSKTKVLDNIEAILFLRNRDATYDEIVAILEDDLNVKITASWLKRVVLEHLKKHPQTTEVGRVPGAPAQTPSAPQTNQVAQPPKAPIQASQAVQSSGSPVKEVKAPVAVTEPAKEVKTTLEGKKAEEVKPAGESAGKFEFISPVSHLKKEGGCSAEEIIQEMREKDALKELREAVLLASIRKEDFTAEKASRIFQRPVTEEEIPMLLEKANKQFREENADQIRKMEENAKRKAASKLF